MKLSANLWRLTFAAAAFWPLQMVTSLAASPAADLSTSAGHVSNLTAKMTLLDGTSRTVTLEGVGCSERLCSRQAIRGLSKAHPQIERTRLDSIARIQDITADGAL